MEMPVSGRPLDMLVSGAPKHAASLTAFLRKRALELLTVPAEDRDAHYNTIHATGQRVSMAHGRCEQEASAWALKVVLLTRLMVRILEKDASAFSATDVEHEVWSDVKDQNQLAA
ncbi:MAG TPA: hypothetical protein VGN97_22935 [Mesorhizobium sp.]|jgi:hypothetical protein|nr:hypothetical protein [Mesorhizobium sp.]